MLQEYVKTYMLQEYEKLCMDIHQIIFHNTPPWMSITKCCLIKNLARKTQWDKTMAKEKRVQHNLLPLIKCQLRSFNLRKPIL